MADDPITLSSITGVLGSPFYIYGYNVDCSCMDFKHCSGSDNCKLLNLDLAGVQFSSSLGELNLIATITIMIGFNEGT